MAGVKWRDESPKLIIKMAGVPKELWAELDKVSETIGSSEEPDLYEDAARAIKKSLAKLGDLSKQGDTLNDVDRAHCMRYVKEWSSLQKDARWYTKHKSVRFGNSMCVDLPCLLFLLECKLRTFVNDEAWYEEEVEAKRDFDANFEQSVWNDRLKFALNDIHYYNTHPRLFYSMSEVKQTLVDLHRTKSAKDFKFLVSLLKTMRDRLCLLLTYPYPADVNDVDAYVIDISDEGLMLPNSRFLWDMFYLYQSTRRKMIAHQQLMKLPASLDNIELLDEALPSINKWFVNMIITAAGDDLNVIFRNYFIKHHLADWELKWFERMNQKTDVKQAAPYKIMVSTRGIDEANEMLATGGVIVKNLLMIKEGSTQHDVVTERVKSMEAAHVQILLQCILDYAVNRKWTFEFDNYVMNPNFTADTALHYPVIRHVPFTSTFAVANQTRCKDLFDATIVWAYTIMDKYKGTIYNPVSKQGIACTEQLHSMLKYAPKMKTI